MVECNVLEKAGWLVDVHTCEKQCCQSCWRHSLNFELKALSKKKSWACIFNRGMNRCKKR
jgi:hypothetical protein